MGGILEGSFYVLCSTKWSFIRLNNLIFTLKMNEDVAQILISNKLVYFLPALLIHIVLTQRFNGHITLTLPYLFNVKEITHSTKVMWEKIPQTVQGLCFTK